MKTYWEHDISEMITPIFFYGATSLVDQLEDRATGDKAMPQLVSKVRLEHEGEIRGLKSIFEQREELVQSEASTLATPCPTPTLRFHRTPHDIVCRLRMHRTPTPTHWDRHHQNTIDADSTDHTSLPCPL
jgi:hypothetical protein